MHRCLKDQRAHLEHEVADRTRDLEQSRTEALECLARAAEYRDDETGKHAIRVGRMSAALARALGMNEEDVRIIQLAAPLHDIGKIGITDAILQKPGPLTRYEFEVIKTHTTIGSDILGECMSPLLKKAKQIALFHHERWNGSGYPQGLRAEQIPLACRIVAIADTYDALVSDRPYKAAWSHKAAVDEIRRQRGITLDPAVVDAFLAIYAIEPPKAY
jgi:putative two-component system response regulator